MKTVTASKEYAARQRTEIKTHTMGLGYFVSGITGMMAGIITFLKIDSSHPWLGFFVSLMSAIVFGAAGAAGKYMFDKWGKKKIDRIVSKIFKKKKR